jgi:hypothetical protein
VTVGLLRELKGSDTFSVARDWTTIEEATGTCYNDGIIIVRIIIKTDGILYGKKTQHLYS